MIRKKKRHVSLRRETVLKYMLETMEKFSLHLSTFFLAVASMRMIRVMG